MNRIKIAVLEKGLLIVIGLIFIYPLLITWTNSFMTEGEITWNYVTNVNYFDRISQVKVKFVQMKWIPRNVSMEQYSNVLIYQPAYLQLMLNSIKIAVPVVVGNLIVSVLGAYGFTIWKWKYKEALFSLYVLVMLMPLQAVLVPNYIVAAYGNIQNSYWAIILPGIFAPFGTFLLRQTMKVIPPAYYEAAKMDGAGLIQIFWYVVIPQMKSGITALMMLVFIEYWNVVEQAVIFIKEYYRQPLSVYLSRIGEGKMGMVFAASCVYMVLPLWALLIAQKDLEKGIEFSGIK